MALQLAIPTYVQRQTTTFYQIEIFKAYDKLTRKIERRFNNFKALHEELS